MGVNSDGDKNGYWINFNPYMTWSQLLSLVVEQENRNKKKLRNKICRQQMLINKLYYTRSQRWLPSIAKNDSAWQYPSPDIDRSTFERLYRQFEKDCLATGTTFDDFLQAHQWESVHGFIFKEKCEYENSLE
ncbi:hypothetical protein [Paenibacillus hexagrammi]|uniref:Uncharacterized protein n=1 Tax=Paenibacillus hexagrammi TaxID=2908839 RepID=A0ABY3SRN9_9BACL|nr:hypothetical protein [Paenibacillus sp. YPD9-1]UJF36614.1 hypothetical protein L0M14_30460 [Paenibacillus sp. YPD9-1]